MCGRSHKGRERKNNKEGGGAKEKKECEGGKGMGKEV